MRLSFFIKMKQLKIIFAFYTPLIFWSIIVCTILFVINPSIVPALITKLLLTILLWYVTNEFSGKKKLVFYYNVGLSSLKLYGVTYFMDTCLTIIIFQLLKTIL